jgi:hypothetical protein
MKKGAARAEEPFRRSEEKEKENEQAAAGVVHSNTKDLSQYRFRLRRGNDRSETVEER